MQALTDMLLFRDVTAGLVWVGCMCIAISASFIGTFTFLRKRSLLGDAIAHAILPGVCLAFLVTATKEPWALLIGAFISGWISVFCMDWIVKYTPIKPDTATGIVLSVFFALGILLLTYIQQSGNAAQSGLHHFLFGKAAAMQQADVQFLGWLTLGIVGIGILFFRAFKVLSFQGAFVASLGWPVRTIEFLLSSLTVLTVAAGIQAVGVVLMAALLVTPVAAARFWTYRLPVLILLAVAFSVVSGTVGAYISYVAPAMPTGPWIVAVVSVLAFLSFYLAPKTGILAKQWRHRQYMQKIREENFLKALYHHGEAHLRFDDPVALTTIQAKTGDAPAVLKNLMRVLSRKQWIKHSDGMVCLTPEGKRVGQRITKLHRLWEVYLTRYAGVADDQVHHEAEDIEHLITPELEQKLEALLAFPQTDPHDKKIPYDNHQ